MAHVSDLNHAVLWIRDLDRSVAFYRDVLGMEVVEQHAGRAAFLRARGSGRHHSLGLFAIGADAAPVAPAPGGQVALYHLAWQVDSITDLAEIHDRLAAAGALVGASDHGVSKSLYARDPDGLEFEVMFALPPEAWGDAARQQYTRPLDLAKELATWA